MILTELVDYLVTQSIGVKGTTLFGGYQPTDPDACVSLQEYQGRTSASMVRVFGQAEVEGELARIQVLTRGLPEDYDAPRLKANDVYRALSRVMSTTLGATVYRVATPLQPPFPLERDGRLRYVFAVNVEVYKAVSAT